MLLSSNERLVSGTQIVIELQYSSTELLPELRLSAQVTSVGRPKKRRMGERKKRNFHNTKIAGSKTL